jgi:hypothetical protein
MKKYCIYPAHLLALKIYTREYYFSRSSPDQASYSACTAVFAAW